jgi:DNA-binding XRE family transcriptional regulator
MVQPSTRPKPVILGEARRTLGMTQRQFGAALGSSHRTAVRWEAGKSAITPNELVALARLLHPLDRDLAEEVASLTHETLVTLGIEAPPPPPPPPAPPPPPRPFPRDADLVDVVVCAGIEATGHTPTAIRALVYTLFKRAREVGLTTEAVEQALAPAAVQTGAAAGGAKAKGS